MRAGEPERAQIVMQALVRRYATTADDWQLLAQAASASGDDTLARQALAMAVRSSEAPAPSLRIAYIQALAQSELDRPAFAQARILMADDADVTGISPEVRRICVAVALRIGELEQAVTWLQVIPAEPKDIQQAELLWLRAQLFFRQGDLRAAQADAKQAADLLVLSPQQLLWYGSLFDRQYGEIASSAVAHAVSASDLAMAGRFIAELLPLRLVEIV